MDRKLQIANLELFALSPGNPPYKVAVYVPGSKVSSQLYTRIGNINIDKVVMGGHCHFRGHHLLCVSMSIQGWSRPPLWLLRASIEQTQ